MTPLRTTLAQGGHVHLLGIGGSGMAALAGLLKLSGYRVTGSDTALYPPASTLLEEMGIRCFGGFRESHLHPRPDLVVVGNIIARGNPELECVLDDNLPYRSMPETIRELLLPGHTSLVVAGTHGKTTTTSMLAWILEAAGRRPNFFIGGVAGNFGRSFGLGGGEEFVVEGDEYETALFDRGPKFYHYRPHVLLITSLEYDHADNFPDLAALELAFRRLAAMVPRAGRIIAFGESDAVRRVASGAHTPVETFGLSPECHWCAGDIEFSEGVTRFRILRAGAEFARVELPAEGGVGRIAVLNALGAAAAAAARGVSGEEAARALGRFRGVRRRMQVVADVAGVLLVDDFAHHPTAIRETIAAARMRWPGRRLWAVVEPRSNTMRRKVFEGVLPAALAGADAVLLGPVHRARLLSDEERLSPAAVCAELRRAGRQAAHYESADALAGQLLQQTGEGDVVLVMSNGSFDGLLTKLAAALAARGGRAR